MGRPVEEYVLIRSADAKQDELMEWLRTIPAIDLVRPIEYGQFDLLVRVRDPSHHEIQHVITSRLRFHKGVARVEEIGDGEEAAGILDAVDIETRSMTEGA
ncbi:MAG: hypothetical protein ACYDDF_11900 [Thermoplasmatota archaeon]